MPPITFPYDDIEITVPEGQYPPNLLMLPTAKLAASVKPRTVIDLGCGPGTQGIWVAKHTGATVWGVDRSYDAVTWARRNAERYGIRAFFSRGELYQPLLKGRADVIVNTLPYEPKWVYEGEEYRTPKDTYESDGSFGAALYYGHEYAPWMAVWGMPGMEEAFDIAGWDVKDHEDDEDDEIRHFLLRSRSVWICE